MILLLVLFVYSLQAFSQETEKASDEDLLDFANENDTKEEPPTCLKPLPTKTSSSEEDDDDDDDDGGLPPQEEPPCVPPLEEEPTEEEVPAAPADDGNEPTDDSQLTDGGQPDDEAQPAQLDDSDYDETKDTELAGT